MRPPCSEKGSPIFSTGPKTLEGLIFISLHESVKTYNVSDENDSNLPINFFLQINEVLNLLIN